MSLLRASSPVKADYDELSSPDPLGNSSQEFQGIQTSSSRRGSRGPTPSNIQIKKQARLSIDPELSPSKTVTEQTLSPWRIRVTVEAEPEENVAEMEHVTRTKTVTRTIKIPLRDESSPLPSVPTTQRDSNPQSVKKGRRRSGTPDRNGRTRRPSLTDLDAIVLGDDRDEDEWSAKKNSPRKRRNSKSKFGQRKSSASRRGSQAAEFEIREDEDAAPAASIETEDNPTSEPSCSPELRQIDLNRVSIRPRSVSMKDKENTKSGKPESNIAHQSILLNASRKVSTNSAMSYPTPSPSASDHGHSDELPGEKGDEVQRDLNNDEVFDTMMESEGFTMIDLDSLPSIKNLRSSPEQRHFTELDKVDEAKEQNELESNDHSYQSTAASVTYPVILSEDETGFSAHLPSSPPEMSSQANSRAKPYSIGHLQIPSSTHVHRQRQVTPQTCSSPQLPSPPKPAPIRDRATPNSAKAMNAGRALQGALTPYEPRRDVAGDAKIAYHSSEEDQIFEGFDSSTRRELRAGLRFGEELAKRQKDSPTTIIQDLRNQNARFDSHVQVWRNDDQGGEMSAICATTTDSKPFTKSSGSLPDEFARANKEDQVFADQRALLEQEWQMERDATIKKAEKSDVIIIQDESEAELEEHDVDEEIGNETEGDIWLAEAKNTSSPDTDVRKATNSHFTDSERRQREKAREALEKPKRKLVPSPWKRGEHLVPEHADTTTMLSADTSISGLFWKEPSSDNDFRFGAGIVAKPDRMSSDPQMFDRRGSGELTREKIWRQTQRISPRQDKSVDDMNNVEDLAIEENDNEWRNAEEVVEEETTLLEAQKEAGHTARVFIQSANDNPMRLHETSLEDVPEQDLSSSPHQICEQQTIPVHFNDESVASVSDESTIYEYRQRRSLSPSKERPGTPRSALKGARLSYGFTMNASDEETSDRRVAWAKRSSCVNEEWEESSRSVRSMLESEHENTSILLDEHEQERAGFGVDPESKSEDKEPQSSKGWFNWIRGKVQNSELNSSSSTISSLDGTKDEDDSVHQEGDYAPTSRHLSSYPQTTRHPTPTTTSLSQQSTSSPSSSSRSTIPSYLLPPSYPSDPKRNIAVPLSTAGEFSNIHFRTLHIIYRKSQKSRFHAPQYPDEVRPEIQNMVKRKWSMDVDEGQSPLGEVFTFKVREMEGRVLERFMREVEHGYSGQKVQWGWSVEQLAGWMGRIAVGEVVRAEEAQIQMKVKK